MMALSRPGERQEDAQRPRREKSTPAAVFSTACKRGDRDGLPHEKTQFTRSQFVSPSMRARTNPARCLLFSVFPSACRGLLCCAVLSLGGARTKKKQEGTGGQLPPHTAALIRSMRRMRIAALIALIAAAALGSDTEDTACTTPACLASQEASQPATSVWC
jgi:hypothetical protein